MRPERRLKPGVDGGLRAASWSTPLHHLRTAKILSKRWGPPHHQNILTPATTMIPFSLFLLAAVARDYLAEKRIHLLTIWLAIFLFVSQPIEGFLIAPSAAWHQIAAWLTG
jgi:hypothetical protein